MLLFFSLFLFLYKTTNAEIVARWDTSDCPLQPMIAESNRAKQVVSRSYPTSFGTVWSCDYAITVPDNTKKILVDFQDMLLIGKQFPEGKFFYFF